MKIINIKLDKDKKNELKRLNELLEKIDFDDTSLKMEKLISKLNAKRDDYIFFFLENLNNGYYLSIDIASGNTNYYDNIQILEKQLITDDDYYFETKANIDCTYKIENMELSKEEFDFLDDDYLIKLI